jgi:hypothetical protein
MSTFVAGICPRRHTRRVERMVALKGNRCRCCSFMTNTTRFHGNVTLTENCPVGYEFPVKITRVSIFLDTRAFDHHFFLSFCRFGHDFVGLVGLVVFLSVWSRLLSFWSRLLFFYLRWQFL